jgi:hypothetical protein
MRQAAKVSNDEEGTTRMSVTFTKAQRDQLLEIAVHNEVSVGYVVRKACDAYLRCQTEEMAVHHLVEPANV